MGKGGGGNVSSQVTAAEEPVTPAVARNAADEADKAAESQAERRSRLRGIRSTYSRFASEQGATNGTARKLG